MRHLLIASALAGAAVPAVAIAPLDNELGKPVASNLPARVASGRIGDVAWQARSMIVGQTSTATIAGGGDPIYLPSRPQKDGVVGLLMTYEDGAQFVCSGSLASDRRSIVTAAHCVSGGFGTPNPVRTQAIFWNGSDTNQIWFEPGVTSIDVTQYFINPGYTGEVVDQNDIAVLRLASTAPDFATSYGLYLDPDLTGLDFNVAGYGGRSDTGGAIGANLGTGRLREGDNRYDFRLGDADFAGEWDGVFGTADVTFSYLSDFDNGLAANDASCGLVATFFPDVAGLPKYCNTGVGAREVGIAGGDSGGPGFVDGKIATVNSYGLTYGLFFSPGDVDDFLNSSWGEFSGYVPLYIHRDFLLSSFVPEPATWAMMIAGFGLVGVAARRRRGTVAAA